MTLPPDQRHATTTENRILQDDSCNSTVLGGHIYVRYWVTGWPRWGSMQCTDCARPQKDHQRGAG